MKKSKFFDRITINNLVQRTIGLWPKQLTISNLIQRMIGLWPKQSKIKRFYRLNQYIQAPQLRLIDEKGEQLGIISRDEALFKARQAGLDLVEVASNTKPPVCKIIDFKKFKYQEDKKQRAGKKKNKAGETKEMRFTPFIAKGDYDLRIRRAKAFLEEGEKVRLTVRFVGRQISRKQFGYDLLKKVNDTLGEISKVEVEPKWHGRMLSMVLKPSQKQPSVEIEKKSNEQTKNQKISNQKI